MLYFSCSVLNTPPSTRRISRRITLSRVVLLPVNVMRLTKYCSPSVIRIVMFDRRLGGPGNRPLGRVLERHVGETGELEISSPAVELARFLEPLADILFRVPLPALQPEERLKKLAVDDLVAVERDLANPVAIPFGDWNAQLHPARFFVRRVLEGLDLGSPDAGLDVALLTIELLDLVGVLLELRPPGRCRDR